MSRRMTEFEMPFNAEILARFYKSHWAAMNNIKKEFEEKLMLEITKGEKVVFNPPITIEAKVFFKKRTRKHMAEYATVLARFLGQILKTNKMIEDYDITRQPTLILHADYGDENIINVKIYDTVPD